MTNSSGRVRLDDADRRGFWRGVSPLWTGETQIGPAFETVQTSAGVEGWRQRGGAPEHLTQNQWSLRTSLALEPTGLPLFATATPEGDGWRVRRHRTARGRRDPRGCARDPEPDC